MVLIGCIGTTHIFKIRFNDIQGMRENDQVFFDKTAIGKVTGIEYTDTGNYLVSVAVEDQFLSLPKDSSTFYIDSNPESEGRKAIWIIQIKDGGNIIKKNAIVRLFSSNRLFSKKPITILFHESLTELCLLPE